VLGRSGARLERLVGFPGLFLGPDGGNRARARQDLQKGLIAMRACRRGHDSTARLFSRREAAHTADDGWPRGETSTDPQTWSASRGSFVAYYATGRPCWRRIGRRPAARLACSAVGLVDDRHAPRFPGSDGSRKLSSSRDRARGPLASGRHRAGGELRRVGIGGESLRPAVNVAAETRRSGIQRK